VGSFTGIHPFLLVSAAAGLDRLVGDPRWCLHPVVVMGWWIRRLQQLAERWAGDRPWALRLGGGVITALLVGGSGGAGWLLEQWALGGGLPDASPEGLLLLWIALASALAGRSLEQAVRGVLRALPDLAAARTALSWIVGRDTTGLNQAEIVRAAAETASENAVDGLFAPLFWMLVGAGLWSAGLSSAPGPLALAWGFKAASTLDSMLGYRQGKLLWLGTAGARLDDLLVWLPCRLVALSLPLAAGAGPGGWLRGLAAALRDGAPDPSPNAGVSQAAYAHATGVQLGGLNRYGDQIKAKPLLGNDNHPADKAAVEHMIQLTLRLEGIWLLFALALALLKEA
jgi:adenosylcobinamide-phosphate synthase